MKTSLTIIRDLAAGQSTIDPLAERLRQPAAVLSAFLDDLITDGLVESAPIGNPNIGRKLTVYRLTLAGREAAARILQPA
jgi:predicted ArsR family transcriptional regulator